MTNNTNYPPVHAAIYYDSYSNPVGSGLTRHWFCRRCRVLSSVVGRGPSARLSMATLFARSSTCPIGIRLLLLRSYYIPPVGVIPIVTIGANTIDGVPNAGSPICGMVRVRAVVSFKNMKE